MADNLRALTQTEQAKNPIAAVDYLVQELPIKEKEKDSILTTFLRDGDFSQFGMASAVTEVANNPELANLDRVNELETIGGKILDLDLRQWGKIANAEKVAA